MKIYQGELNARGFRFALVSTRWNEFVTARLVSGAFHALQRLGASEKLIAQFKVPGAFELPLIALKAAQSRRFDAVICLGAVIRGETPHFDYIAGEAASGIARAGFQTGVPAIFGVITANTVEQALDRAGATRSNKGYEAAVAAVEMVNLCRSAFR